MALLLGCLLVAISPHANAEERIWTDKSGKFQVSAELVDVVDGKVRLKRPDGRIINVPKERLSEEDQQHLDGLTGNGGEAAEEPLKVGDKVYLQVRGQWQLGEIKAVHDGPGAARFEVALKTGSRRTMKVAEKRLRRYGKAGDQGLLLPGDVVEILDTWGKEVVNTGVVVRVKGTWAYVQPEGQLGEKSYRLSSLRAPGTGPTTSLQGRVASAAESNRKPGQKAHPADTLTYPDPELTPANFGLARPIEIASPGAPTTITIRREPARFDAKGMRRLPVKLTPEKDTFWDKFLMATVSADGTLAAALKKTRDKHSQLELVPLTKTRSGPKLFGLPPGTLAVEPSPDGRLVATRREETFGKNPKVDLWRVVWDSESKKTITGLEHLISWSPVEDGKSALKAARWLDGKTYLTLDKKKRLVAWEAETATATRSLDLGKKQGFGHTFIEGSDLLALSQPKRGVALLDLRSMEVVALIGADRVRGTQASFSPSGTLMAVADRNRTTQFWDLTTGQLILEAMLAGKQHGQVTWSNEEGIILLGGQRVDIRTWNAIPGRPSTARSYAGVAWGVQEKANPPLFGGTPTLPPLTEAGPRPNSDTEYALAPGDGIALEVKADSAIAEATRRRFAKMIQDQGFRLDDASPFRLTLATKMKTESQEYGKGLGALRGEKGNFTVSYRIREYSTSFSYNGRVLLSGGNAQAPPVGGFVKSEAAARQAANERMDPDASLFASLTLPQRVIQIKE